MKIDEKNFLTMLQKHKPYLYMLEKELSKVKKASGYGDVAFSCILRDKKVFSYECSSWTKWLNLD